MTGSPPRVTIVDYGMGNLRSVAKALEYVGARVTVTAEPAAVDAAERLVLPGVGAFADAMTGLAAQGLLPPLRRLVASGRPFLGICLGLQVLLSRSHEDGEHEGLGLFEGEVLPFDAASLRPRGLKIPHMGWTPLRLTAPACPLWAGIPPASSVYFVHSYVARPADPAVVAAEADHGGPFTAALWRTNLLATQFHPEKSQEVGLAMLRNFIGWSP